MSQNMDNIPRISEMVKKKTPDTETKPLTELGENKDFIIEQVQFFEGSMGEYAVIQVGNQHYRTSSQVIVDELKRLRWFPVRARLVKKKSPKGRYYHLLE